MDDNNDETLDHETGNALGRIARILDVPAASFFAPKQSPTLGGVGTAATDEGIVQALAVMRLFLQLRDPEARARCLSFITQELLQDR